MPETAIDHDARSRADLALERIANHERRCEERWTEARTETRGLREDIKQLAGTVRHRNAELYSRIWWMVGGAFTLLLAVIGWLASRI